MSTIFGYADALNTISRNERRRLQRNLAVSIAEAITKVMQESVSGEAAEGALRASEIFAHLGEFQPKFANPRNVGRAAIQLKDILEVALALNGLTFRGYDAPVTAEGKKNTKRFFHIAFGVERPEVLDHPVKAEILADRLEARAEQRIARKSAPQAPAKAAWSAEAERGETGMELLSRLLKF